MKSWKLICALPALGGCVGAVGGAADLPPRGNPGAPPSPAPTPGATGQDLQPALLPPQALRRLTTPQFGNALRALLGDVTVGQVEQDAKVEGLSTVGAIRFAVSEAGVEKYGVAIDSALDQVFADATKRNALIGGCVPQVTAGDGCTRMFIERFGRLAWRRPLTATEATRYSTLAADNAKLFGDAYAGMRWATAGLLRSPYFLYRTELGQPEAGRQDRRILDRWEVASRLAFFLWDGPPDAALLQAAEAGEFASADGISQQAQRMLRASQSHNAVADFVQDLFSLDALLDLPKDAKLFPGFTSTLKAAMAREVTQLWAATAFDTGSSALELFTTRKHFVNRELAMFYGMNLSGLSDNTLAPITLPAATPRAGLLGLPAILALYANQKESQPTRRGKFVREVLLCQTVLPPPKDVDTKLKDPPAGVQLTKRERMEQHAINPACKSCHGFLDPPGFGLEQFDAIGAYRSLDNGKPINPMAELDGVAFDGAAGLGELLASSTATSTCLVRNLYRYGIGAAGVSSDDGAVEQLADRFRAGGYRLGSLILDIVTSDGFRFVAVRRS